MATPVFFIKKKMASSSWYKTTEYSMLCVRVMKLEPKSFLMSFYFLSIFFFLFLETKGLGANVI